MIEYFKDLWLSYAIASLLVACILCIPTIRKSPHTTLWRIFLPGFAAFHVAVSWWLLGKVFELEDGKAFSEVAWGTMWFIWGCFTNLFTFVYHCVSRCCRYDLEFHVPIAFGSVIWSMMLSLSIACAINRRAKKGHNTPEGICQPADGLPKPSA